MAKIFKLPDSTIQMIAAGEVITRPVNVAKELIENSLDAGATNIRITFEQGGAKLIEIVDNGHGIALYNAEQLCRRYTTSKLQCADDLTRLSTFGFRGEALASISEMADIEVSTFNKQTDHMGWTAKYYRGELVEPPLEKYLQNTGTHLKITKLFESNYARRRAILSNFVDEKKAIIDMVTCYAIHHRSKLTLSLKETNSNDIVCLLAPMETKPCIGLFHGMEMENNLIEFDLGGGVQDGFTVKGHLMFSYKKSASAYSQSNFILFVNDRLVECVSLKKEFETIVNEFLSTKTTAYFIYVSLQVPPEDVDVNTHPSKATVALHYQSEITSLIVSALRHTLNEKFTAQPTYSMSPRKPSSQTPTMKMSSSGVSPHNVSSSINTERLSLLLGSPSMTQSSRESNNYAITNKRPFDLIHSDSTQQTLAQFSAANRTRKNSSTPRRQSHEPIKPWPGISYIGKAEREKEERDCPDLPGFVQASDLIEMDPSLRSPKRSRRNLNLKSIVDLKLRVGKEKSQACSQTIRKSVFVGLFDHDHALIQHGTKLMAINLRAFLKEQYYQFYLFDFGNFPPIDILPPGNKIRPLIEAYLDDIRKHEPIKYENLQFQSVDVIIDQLESHSCMYEDYLTLTIKDERILTIPCIIPEEVPNLVFLGKFLVELVNLVDYSEERHCLRMIGRVLADFYSYPPANLKSREVHLRYHDTVESKLYVAIKNYLMVPEWLFTEENICQISDTKDLYKVFERC